MSFKASIVQYVGRILRTYLARTTVEVHDHVDSGVGILAAPDYGGDPGLGCRSTVGQASPRWSGVGVHRAPGGELSLVGCGPAGYPPVPVGGRHRPADEVGEEIVGHRTDRRVPGGEYRQ